MSADDLPKGNALAPPVLNPQACQTLADVRAGVDAVDLDLVSLIAERFGYMQAAARIKTERGAVRDEARKRAVIDHAVAEGKARGIPDGLIAALWEQLVEASIAYELRVFDSLHSGR